VDNTNRRSALLVSTLGSFLTPFMGSSINTALPSMGKELALDTVSLGWVTTSYLLASAIFLVPFGRVADIHGRKRVFIVGVFIYTVASLLLTVSESPAMVIALRIPQGIGAAMIFGTGVAILTSAFPVGERGKALGINSASVYLGLSLGPFLGGVLTQQLGWRSIFLVNVPLGLVIIIVASWRLRGEWAEARGERLDLLGSLIYSLTLTTLMYGLYLLPASSGMWLISIGGLGVVAFFKVETKSQNPILNVNLFRRNTTFTFSNLAALMNYSATYAVSFLLSLYLQSIKGLSPQNAGLVLVSQPIVQTAFSPLAGRLSDRMEPRIIASIGMALTSAALFALAVLIQGTNLELIIACLVLLGIGLALFASPNTNAVMSSVEKQLYGVASATIGTMRLLGQMLSMGITMLIFTVFIGRTQIMPEYYPLFLQSIRTALMTFAALSFTGISASLVRGKVR